MLLIPRPRIRREQTKVRLIFSKTKSQVLENNFYKNILFAKILIESVIDQRYSPLFLPSSSISVFDISRHRNNSDALITVQVD